jgi:molybdopterin-guanine dinucleotide biosynthesis protein A
MVPDTVGVILAGGQARRMGGGDKALLMLAGETLLGRAIARAKPQVQDLIINANGDPARFAVYGLPVIADRVQGFLGPLAGILSALEWMRAHRPNARWLASFACDSPIFPTDMVEQLVSLARETQSRITVAESGGRTHPVFAVWSAEIAETSESVLVKDGFRKVEDWIAGFPHRSLGFSVDPVDPFLNVNTPGQLAFAEDFIARQGAIR